MKIAFLSVLRMNQKNKRNTQFTSFVIAVLTALTFSACANRGAGQQSYGVFLSFTDDLEQLGDYETVVIDAQYYSADQIADFQGKGHQVYSYINVGALEDFRDYYDAYKDLALDKYEH